MTEIERWNAAVDTRKRAKHEAKLGRTTGRPIGPIVPKPGSAHPFRRAQAYYMHVLELKSKYQHDLPLLQTLINGLPPYRSRGHGGKHRTKNRTGVPAPRSKYQPHQGRSEAARRVFSALPAEQRAFIRRIEKNFAEYANEDTGPALIGVCSTEANQLLAALREEK